MISRIPIPSRTIDFFLSHSSCDKPIAESIVRWANTAGLNVFFDSESLTGDVDEAIGRAIANSRAGVVLWSPNSVQSSWVKVEAGRFQEEAKSPDFQIAHLIIDDCSPPSRADLLRQIDCRQGFGAEQAVLLVETLFSHETRPDLLEMKPVYMARGGRPHEARNAKRIIAALTRLGIRVVRDAPHNDFDCDRIASIMQSCRGVVALIPKRETKDGKPTTSEFILTELALAYAQNLPILTILDDELTGDALAEAADRMFIAEELLARKPGSSPMVAAGRSIREDLLGTAGRSLSTVWRLASGIAEDNQLLDATVHFLEGLRRPPEKPANCFFGHVYDSKRARVYALAKRCIQSVAGMACASGNDFRQDRTADQVQPSIIRTIKGATFAIVDVSDDEIARDDLEKLEDASQELASFVIQRNWALNTCIEAGVAMGAGIPTYFVARGPQRDPIFMLRNQQIYWYESDVDLIALLRRICQVHRRISESA